MSQEFQETLHAGISKTPEYRQFVTGNLGLCPQKNLSNCFFYVPLKQARERAHTKRQRERDTHARTHTHTHAKNTPLSLDQLELHPRIRASTHTHPHTHTHTHTHTHACTHIPLRRDLREPRPNKHTSVCVFAHCHQNFFDLKREGFFFVSKRTFARCCQYCVKGRLALARCGRKTKTQPPVTLKIHGNEMELRSFVQKNGGACILNRG